ncbi:MAG: hypothetical protein ACREFT_11070, partial [Acetobacteraceae bacterium]
MYQTVCRAQSRGAASKPTTARQARCYTVRQTGEGTVQESPHFKRSALWQQQRQITAWLQEGYS